MINIDGIPHQIRFGAPSRELYIGGTPFRGAFGGPPMIANINGRKHELKLCGPPPEVRIDKDPCYELSRHMGKLRAPQPPQPQAESMLLNQGFRTSLKLLFIDKPDTIKDVQKLLRKIKARVF